MFRRAALLACLAATVAGSNDTDKEADCPDGWALRGDTCDMIGAGATSHGP
jgi:hypothetical protein